MARREAARVSEMTPRQRDTVMAVSEACNVSPRDLLSSGAGTRQHSDARAVLVLLLRDRHYNDMSVSSVGFLLGRSDKAVRNALARFEPGHGDCGRLSVLSGRAYDRLAEAVYGHDPDVDLSDGDDGWDASQFVVAEPLPVPDVPLVDTQPE